ncbi:MAG: SdrD B-like domain-containing protein, partial [Dolichospermum sp.]
SGTLGNYVWKDNNGDGLQNDGTASGINGVKIYLWKDNGTGTFVKVDSTTTANNASGKSGYYLFKNLDNGNYKVQFPVSQGSGAFPLTIVDSTAKVDGNSDAKIATGFSGIATINLFGTALDINNTTIDAGYKTNIGSLGNYVWVDTNADGVQNEPTANGINGVKVYLYKPGASGAIGASDQILIDSTLTTDSIAGKPGYYTFNNLQSGSYYVQFPRSNGVYPLTKVNQAATTNGNSDANTTTGYSSIAIINVNGTGQQVNNTTIDAGYRTNIGSIGNFVWNDDNGNGLQDDGVLSGINGVKVYLYKPGVSGVVGGVDQILVDSTITADNTSGLPGAYLFNNLLSGDYYVKFPKNIGNYPITPTTNQAATIDGNNDANKTTGYSGKVTIDITGTGVQVNNYTIDAGYRTNIGSIGNYVWKDNGDGLQNDGIGNGVNGVKVYLYKSGADGIVGNNDDIIVDSTITANDTVGKPGYYIFDNLTTGSYYIKFPKTLYNSPLTTVNQAEKTDGNSDANVTTGNSEKVLLNTNSNNPLDINNNTIDAGYVCNVPQPIVTGLAGYCPNDSVKLTATSGFQGYQWYKDGIVITGATDSIYHATTIGNYTVTMQDPNACTSNPSAVKSITAYVTPATPTIAYSLVTACKDSGLSVCSSVDFAYQWYWNNTIKTGAINQCIYPDTTGYYKVKTFNATQCPSAFSDSVFITINYTPKAIIAARSSTTICSTGTVQLCPLNWGYSNYRWYKNGVQIASTSCITVGDSGYYQLQGQNGAGCWGPLSDSIKVTVASSIPKPVISTSDTSICPSETTTLTSNSIGGNQWYKNGVAIGGATSQTYSATESGIYTVVVNGGSCPSSDTSNNIKITQGSAGVPPIIIATTATTCCTGDSVKLCITAPLAGHFQWYKDGVVITNDTTTCVYVKETGIYTATVKDSLCNSLPSNEIKVKVGLNPGFVVTEGVTVCDTTLKFISSFTNPGATITWDFG